MLRPRSGGVLSQFSQNKFQFVHKNELNTCIIAAWSNAPPPLNLCLNKSINIFFPGILQRSGTKNELNSCKNLPHDSTNVIVSQNAYEAKKTHGFIVLVVVAFEFPHRSTTLVLPTSSSVICPNRMTMPGIVIPEAAAAKAPIAIKILSTVEAYRNYRGKLTIKLCMNECYNHIDRQEPWNMKGHR